MNFFINKIKLMKFIFAILFTLIAISTMSFAGEMISKKSEQASFTRPRPRPDFSYLNRAAAAQPSTATQSTETSTVTTGQDDDAELTALIADEKKIRKLSIAQIDEKFPGFVQCKENVKHDLARVRQMIKIQEAAKKAGKIDLNNDYNLKKRRLIAKLTRKKFNLSSDNDDETDESINTQRNVARRYD